MPRNTFFIPIFLSCLVFTSSYSQDYYSSEGTLQGVTSEGDYTIVEGDCLWNLAFKFLGDPFRWSEIWNLNQYIKNPDLIYPGNKLRIPGSSSSGTYSTSDNSFSNANGTIPTNPIESQTLGLLNPIGGQITQATDDLQIDNTIVSSIQMKNPFSTDFFAAAPFLWTERDIQGKILPGDANVEAPQKSFSYQLFNVMEFKVFGSNEYKVQDTIDIYERLQTVNYNNTQATLVKRSGLAVVNFTRDKVCKALIFKIWNPIKGNQRVSPRTEFKTKTIDTIVAPNVTIKGRVFLKTEQTATPYLYQSFLMDKGSNDGVKIGDIFITYPPKKALSLDACLLTCVVHCGVNSSTLTIMKMFDNRLEIGDEVVLIRRIQFKE